MNDASIEETVVVSNNQQEKENEVVTEKKTLKLRRYYTDGIVHPFDICEWTNSKVEIKNTEGNVIFSQDVEHPVHWDSMAVRVCADKYFKSHDLENHPHGGERSVKDVIHRVCWSIATRAKSMDYVDEESQKILYEELCYIILNQIAAFNSPVFFNWGLYDVYKFKGNSKANRWAIKDRDGEVFKQEYEYENPQGSACKSADTMLHVVECDKLNYDSPIILIEIRIDQLTNLFHMNHNFFVTSDRGLVKVLAAKNNGIKKTFKINFEEGSLRITEDDQVFVKKEEEQWICVKDLLNNYKEYKLNHMYKNWVNIDSIEEFEEEQVYDLETESHSFYANNVLVHNCFITRVEDELVNGKDGIYDWIQTEMSIFANGSGSGVNVSNIRGEDEAITGGGKSSGLISFLEVADTSAGIIKSGGKCLHGDQYVYTQNGPVKARDLENKKFICLSFEPSEDRFKAKWACCWKQNSQKAIYEIYTSHGVFKTSYDHPFRLIDGTAVKAQDLKESDKLFNCNIDFSSGYAEINYKDKAYSFNDIIQKDIFDQPDYVRWPYLDNSEYLTGKYVSILNIKRLNEEDVYSIEVECPTEDDKSPQSGHNYVIWSTSSSHGVGVVVFNTRRAAKMLILDDTHPDLLDFINWKKEEEFKARSLILAGYIQNWSHKKGAYKSVQAQNANNSIALSDAFMKAVINDGDWELKYVLNGKVKEKIKARDIFSQMVEAAWECGDPGVFFKDVANAWNTVPHTGPIRSSNPCMEHLMPDYTACNLSSINLIRFLKEDGTFDLAAFRHVVEMQILAKEVIVGGSSYPSKEIAEMTKNLRPLGLGYCNMGGLIMVLGYPYDSDQARNIISVISSLMTSYAYSQSCKIAGVIGPFKEFAKNKQSFNKVLSKHLEMTNELKPRFKFAKLIHQAAVDSWNETLGLFHKHGARNAQVVVIAPTGTISFIMGTTNSGIEPPFSLVSYKFMSDGSMAELLCQEAQSALKILGYNKNQITDIWEYIKQNGYIEDAPHVNPIHYSVFDTANVNGKSGRCIRPLAHVESIAAATPFISGGISKTINLPEDCTEQDIWNCYIEGWKMGCKALAVYRSGSKWSQPLNSKNKSMRKNIIEREAERTKERLQTSDFYANNLSDLWEYLRILNFRKRASDRAPAERFNFNFGGENIWINAVRYPDNGLSELWLEVGKENPTVNGLADTIGRIVSVSLQRGVPIESICDTMEGLQFNPSGFVGKNDLGIKHAKSISDLTAKVLRRLNEEYSGKNNISDSYNMSNNNMRDIPQNDLGLVSESEQAKLKGYSGVRCETCGSWKCVGTIKCGTCLSCQSAYGTCSG